MLSESIHLNYAIFSPAPIRAGGSAPQGKDVGEVPPQAEGKDWDDGDAWEVGVAIAMTSVSFCMCTYTHC